MNYTDITYNEVGWKNYPSIATKLNAENLLKMECGIKKVVAAVLELRNLLGDTDLNSGKDIIATINALYSQFGGYSGYNLFDVSKVKTVTSGYALDVKIEDTEIVTGNSYTFSTEGEDTVYLYQYDSSGGILSTEKISSDAPAVAFTFDNTCTSFRVMFLTSVGFTSFNTCVDAKIMLVAGTSKLDYEPYTGGEQMISQWDEILQNRFKISTHTEDIEMCKNDIANLQAFIEELESVLGGAY